MRMGGSTVDRNGVARAFERVTRVRGPEATP